MDISNANFLTQLQAVNSTVALVFSSANTMPASVSPADVLYATAEAYRREQTVVNNAATAAPYLNTVGPFTPQVVLFDAQGKPYQDLVAQVRIRQKLTVDDVAGGEGLTRI